MGIQIESLALTVDVAALQRLPEVSPVAGDVQLGPANGRCTWLIPASSCCCTHISFHDQD
jgi:hypothetical protein